VDGYAAIEQNRLKYLHLNQKKLHVDLYQGFQNAIAVGDNNVTAIRQKIILPFFFIVSPGHVVQNYQGAMQYVDGLVAQMHLLHSLAIPNGLRSKERYCSDNNFKIDWIW